MRRFFHGSLVFLASSWTCAHSIQAACPSFAIEVIHSSVPATSQRPSMAIAPDGTPFVSDPPLFAQRTAGGWEFDALPADHAWDLSVAIGTEGLFLAFARSHEFLLAERTASGWSEETIVSVFAPRSQHLVLDQQGRKHCVMLSSQSGGAYVGVVQYAIFDGTRWVTTPVETSSQTFASERLCQVAVDTKSAPHLLIDNHSLKLLRYWKGPGFSLDAEIVGTGEHASLALDDDDNPYVSFYDPATQCLRLASRSAAWTSSVVDDKGDPGRYSSLAIDASGTFHVVYYAAEHRELRHAQRGPDPGDEWSICTIDASTNASDEMGTNCILALDEDGNLHVAYTDGQFQLKYATSRAPLAVEETSMGELKSLYR